MSSDMMRSGDVVTGWPSRSAMRFSFWNSMISWLPLSWSSPSTTARPRTNMPSVLRSTSTTLPRNRRNPFVTFSTASMGSACCSRASRSVRPISSHSVGVSGMQ